MSTQPSLVRTGLAAAALLPALTSAILPTGAIDVYLPEVAASDAITIHASESSFGPALAPFDSRHSHFIEAGSSGASRIGGVGVVPSFPPEDDADLCGETEGSVDYTGAASGRNEYYKSAILVPRGGCSFERKALSAQRLGADAVVIYNTLASRYSLNITNSTEDADDAKSRDYTIDEVIWPSDKLDYDCDYGRALIPEAQFQRLEFTKLPGGYDGETNDGHLEGRTSNNLCVKYDESKAGFVDKCASQRCLVTGKREASDGETKYEACCAWDLHVWLYADSSIPKDNETSEGNSNEVTIPSVFITMEQSSEILDLVRGVETSGDSDKIVMSIYERYRPEYNISAVLIWAFGVFVAWLASYMSSGDYRRVGKAVIERRKFNAANQRNIAESVEDGYRDESPVVTDGKGGRMRSRTPPASPGLEMNAPSNSQGEERTIYSGLHSGAAAREVAAAASGRGVVSADPESLELTPMHAVGFLVMSSTSLLVLFFFKIYAVVKVMYAFGCSGAFAQVILHPALTYVCRRLRWNGPLRDVNSAEGAGRAAMTGGVRGKCTNLLWQTFGAVTSVDIASMVLSYATGAFWLYVAFTVPHPDTKAVYWIIQDIFGLCMCVLFLDTIKLNAVKVGAVLLIVAFFYDIFFVFVTPLLTKHGESIMINVATSGGPPKADPSWCEKYPTTEECKGGDPLPMLFAVPRVGDYQGGMSMLG